MDTVQTPSLARPRIALAIAAALLTAALWPARPVPPAVSSRVQPVVIIDPSIPVVTIVAKRLTPLEKEQMAREDAMPAGDTMTQVSGAGARPLPDDHAL